MLAGRYRDVLEDADGRRLAESAWRPNLLVDGAFTLLASLLKRDPDLEGILYWAVGAGQESWDRSRPATVSKTSHLTAEVRRVAVPPEAIVYVDRHGAESSEPTPELEIRLAFTFPDGPVKLREFGIVGGDATEQPGSGVLINHVIHRRIDLEPAQRLSRRLRLTFGRAADRRWLEVPPHWLSESEPRVVGGVGNRFAEALSEEGITTLEALAESDPGAQAGAIPRTLLVEFRSKARLVLRTAAEIHPPETLHDLTARKVLTTPSEDLARDAGVVETEVIRLREQLATLELALDHRFLRGVTVGALAGGGE